MNNNQNYRPVHSIFIYFIRPILSKSDNAVIKIHMLKIISSDFEIRTINIECGHPEHQSNFNIFDAWSELFLQCISGEYCPTLQSTLVGAEPNFRGGLARAYTRRLSISQMCSMGDMFGDKAGQSSIYIPLCAMCLMGDMFGDKAGQSSTSIPFCAMKLRVKFAM